MTSSIFKYKYFVTLIIKEINSGGFVSFFFLVQLFVRIGPGWRFMEGVGDVVGKGEIIKRTVAAHQEQKLKSIFFFFLLTTNFFALCYKFLWG